MRGMDREDVVHIDNEISCSQWRRKWQPAPAFRSDRRGWWVIVHGVTRAGKCVLYVFVDVGFSSVSYYDQNQRKKEMNKK